LGLRSGFAASAAVTVFGFTFFGPCARFAMAGFGLFELGLELGRLLLPSFLFITALNFVQR
jgi:hypothetical protein